MVLKYNCFVDYFYPRHQSHQAHRTQSHLQYTGHSGWQHYQQPSHQKQPSNDDGRVYQEYAGTQLFAPHQQQKAQEISVESSADFVTDSREPTRYPLHFENLGNTEKVSSGEVSKKNCPEIQVDSNGSHDMIDSLKRIDENLDRKLGLLKNYVDQVRDDIKRNLESLRKHDTHENKGVEIQSSGSADVKYSTPKGVKSAKDEIIDEIKKLLKSCNICEEINSGRRYEEEVMNSFDSLAERIKSLDKKISTIHFGHIGENPANSFDPR